MTQTILLGDYIDVNSESIGKSYSYDQILYLDTSSVTENVFSELTKVSLSEAPSRAKRIVRDGDTVISTVRPNLKHYGYIKNPKPNTVASTGFAVIRPKPEIDSQYLYYWLTCDDRTNYFASIANSQTSTFPAFNPSIIEKLNINLPKPDDQKQIAKILFDIDEKIEVNRRMNEALEQMGQALFKHYFIDSPKAKTWPEGRLEELFDVVMGQSPPGSSYNEIGEGVVFYQGRAEFGVRYPKNRLFTTEPKRMARKGDVLLSVRAPVGDINQATEACCVGRGVAAISSSAGLKSYTYYQTKSLQNRFADFNAEGTVFGAINGNQLKGLKIPHPPLGTREEFDNLMQSFDNQIFNNSMQIEELAKLRDSLLPRLISGKIDL